VLKHLRLAWSPQQISGKQKAMNGGAANGVGADFDAGDPALPVVSHETIYVIPRGDLRKDLIGFLRQARNTRGARGPTPLATRYPRSGTGLLSTS